MIWQNPWGWLGLATLLLPILIHLLGRGRSRVAPFPTLRFIGTSRLLPTQRTRLHDLLLLAVRLTILLAAVAALAQPLFRTTERDRSTGNALARVIILDTSASMHRPTPGGGTAAAAAQREARRLVAEAGTSVVIATAAPARAMAGAAAWLRRQGGRGEVVMVSDFQRGTVDSIAIAALPSGIGVHLLRIPVASSTVPIERRALVGRSEVTAHIVVDPLTTDVVWNAAPLTEVPNAVTMLTAPNDDAATAATLAAATSIGLPLAIDFSRHVTIAMPAFPGLPELLRHAQPMTTPWMTALALRLRDDPLLQSTAAQVTTRLDSVPTTAIVLARNAASEPVVVAVQQSDGTPLRLALVTSASNGTPLAAALVAAVTRALGDNPGSELEPEVVPDARLVTWQRPVAAQTSARPEANTESTASDGRWFWMLVLALLALEGWLRRPVAPPEGADATT